MKILIICVFVWVVAIFLGSTYEGAGSTYTTITWVGSTNGTGGYAATETPQNTLSYLFNMNNAVQHTPIIGSIPLPIPNGDYFSAWYRVVTLRFSFLADYPMFYWIMVMPFALWSIVSLALLTMAAIRGNIVWGLARIDVLICLMIGVIGLLLGVSFIYRFVIGHLIAVKVLLLYMLLGIDIYIVYNVTKKICKRFVLRNRGLANG